MEPNDGLFDESKIIDDGDKSYAKEFLLRFNEFGNISDSSRQAEILDEMRDILEKWGNDFPDDANYTCAYVIMNIVDLKVEELAEKMLKANTSTPINESLHDELIEIMNKIAIMNASFNDSTEDSSVGEVVESASPDNGYAKEFIECFSEFGNHDLPNPEGLIGRMDEIIDSWGKLDSTDANYVCAFVIMNFVSLSNDEIRDNMQKAMTFKPIDKESYPILFEFMTGLMEQESGITLDENFSYD
jgi:hypothetical protein